MVFMAMRAHVQVLWVIAPYSLVDRYQRFEEKCCSHLEDYNPKDYNIKVALGVYIL
jgi:hypothetical protein